VLYLFFFRNPAQFILQCNGHFGFQESFLLFATHITNVPKLKNFVKFWNFDFGTGFGTLIHTQTLGFWLLFRAVPKTIVFGTASVVFIEVVETPLHPGDGVFSRAPSSPFSSTIIEAAVATGFNAAGAQPAIMMRSALSLAEKLRKGRRGS
jgi:hypothetical protein